MERKVKRLAVWFYSISMLLGDYLDITNESFKEIVIGFIMNFYSSNKDILDKMLDFKMINEGIVSVSIDYDKVLKYGGLFAGKPQELIKIYDEIGNEDINKISRLAELFCDYCLEVYDMCNTSKLRRN